MANGLRFFGTSYSENAFGGTISASSADDKKHFAFDGIPGTRWITSNQNTEGNIAILTRDYGFNRTINSFYVYNTNIENAYIEYWDDPSWIKVTDDVNGIVIKSADEAFIFAKLDAEITTDKVRITGGNTLVANREKFVSLFHTFNEIGQLEYFPAFKPRYNPEQNVFKTTDGRNFVIERGEAFSALIDFKSHVNQNDIDLIMTLLDRKEPFFIWPSGGDQSIFRFAFKPFRFRDIFKVTCIGDYTPEYTKNYYLSGLNTPVNIVEVV